MKNRNIIGLVGLPIVALAIIGGTAFAAQSTASAVPLAQVKTQTATPTTETKDTEVSDAQEQVTLANKATVTPEEAGKAAVAKLGGGVVTKATLSDENNELVYEVVIGNQEVKVSATNGKVLEVDVNDGEKGDASEPDTESSN